MNAALAELPLQLGGGQFAYLAIVFIILAIISFFL
jgi:hypothetical protein